MFPMYMVVSIVCFVVPNKETVESCDGSIIDFFLKKRMDSARQNRVWVSGAHVPA